MFLCTGLKESLYEQLSLKHRTNEKIRKKNCDTSAQRELIDRMSDLRCKFQALQQTMFTLFETSHVMHMHAESFTESDKCTKQKKEWNENRDREFDD